MSNHSKHVRRVSRAKKAAALGGGALAAASPLVTSGRAEAATFTVTNLNDSGGGSLRAALDAANANADADTITFQAGLTGTIHLTSERLNVLNSVDIQGPGADVITVDADVDGMVFYVYHNGGPNIDVTISGLTATGGTKAGIMNWGEDLTLDGVVVSGNTNEGNGGGVVSTSAGTDDGVPSLTVIGSTISGNETDGKGGGLYAGPDAGLISVVDSLVTGNTSVQGGGLFVGYVPDTADTVDLDIVRTTVSDNVSTGGGGGIFVPHVQGQVEITDSTISGNSSLNCGGGLYFGRSGGDASVTINRTTVSGNSTTYQGGGVYIYVLEDEVTILDSTVAGNTALDGAGVWARNAFAGVDIVHSTISGNTASGRGGGVAGYDYGDGFLLESTIVAGNSANVGDDIWLKFEPNMVGHHSIIGSLDGATLDGSDNLTGVDPMLGALADNGGHTKTMLPQAGSPAIDAGDPAFTGPPSVDQRGLARVYGGRIDIGAVEVQPAVLPPTGGSNGVMAALGAALLGLGGVLHLGSRRRRPTA